MNSVRELLGGALLAAAAFVPAAARPGVVSRLETVDVATGERRLVRRFEGRVEAPNWTRDGRSLVYNADGRLWRVPVDGGEPVEVDTGFCTRCNNDHVLSADGRALAVSCASPADGASAVYVMDFRDRTAGEPVAPRRVTGPGASYLHGMSPDGRLFAYCAMRPADPAGDVCVAAADGFGERRLTDAPGLDDGPEFSPCGRFIWFNSVRSGLMQVWRMNADGTDQRQITADGDRNCWFPHVSPDGSTVAYLAYRRGDLEPGQHLADKRVEIRLVSADGRNDRLLLGLFGGQGTLNVNSWAPDSRRLAFVSYEVD